MDHPFGQNAGQQIHRGAPLQLPIGRRSTPVAAVRLRRWEGLSSQFLISPHHGGESDQRLACWGFEQPLAIHQHWHIDVSYINVMGTFYYAFDYMGKPDFSRIVRVLGLQSARHRALAFPPQDAGQIRLGLRSRAGESLIGEAYQHRGICNFKRYAHDDGGRAPYRAHPATNWG